MTRPRRRDPVASREKILQVATDMFSQKGYAASGVDELAARTGIAKTAIYYHFGNKEGLLAAVLEQTAREWINRIEAVTYEVSNPLERLDRALAGMRALVEERPDLLKLFQLMALEVAENKPEVKAILHRIGTEARDAIARGIRDALATDLPDAEGVARLVLSVLLALVTGRSIGMEEVPLDTVFAELRRLLILLVAVRMNPSMVKGLEEMLR